MSIEVVVPAPDFLLATRADVKSALGISDADTTKDTLIDDLIAQASAFVTRYTGRQFARETIIEKVAGAGIPALLLSRTPIIAVNEVSINGAEVTDYEIQDVEAGILFRANGWTSTELAYDTLTLHPSGYAARKWTVTYTGGYVLPNWPSGAPDSDGPEIFLPSDLERAVIDMAKTYYNGLSVDGSISMYKIGDTTIQWNRGSSAGSQQLAGLSPMAASVLTYYRRAF